MFNKIGLGIFGLANNGYIWARGIGLGADPSS